MSRRWPISVDSFLVSASIIALGRSDSHALLAPHATSLGIKYIAIEGYEVAEHLRDLASGRHGALTSRIATLGSEGPLLIAAIDSSIPAGMLRSFVLHLEQSGLAPFSLRSDPQLLEKLATIEAEGAKISHEVKEVEDVLLLTIARSPHGQVALWPIISINRAGTISHFSGDSHQAMDQEIDQAIDQAMTEVAEIALVGVLTYVINPEDGVVLRRELGLATITFWSESACYTSVSEQIIRSILDLPLGDARMIDYEEYYLEEEIEVPEDQIKDPIRPFLHLFARNPRLKVRYLAHDHPSGSDARVRTQISLFGSTEEEALTELAHAREFMLEC